MAKKLHLADLGALALQALEQQYRYGAPFRDKKIVRRAKKALRRALR